MGQAISRGMLRTDVYLELAAEVTSKVEWAVSHGILRTDVGSESAAVVTAALARASSLESQGSSSFCLLLEPSWK